MSIVKEFRDFAMRGNLVDMAIGVVIGGAFGKVVTAFIDGLVMPLIGKLTGGVDFNNKYISLSDKVTEALVANPSLPIADAKKVGAVWAYGSFITVLIDFLIVAFVIFLVIKAMNRMKRKEEAAPAAPAPEPVPTKEEVLLGEIRDLLKSKA